MSLRALPEIQAFQKMESLGFQPPASAIAAFDPSTVAADEGGDSAISIYGYIGIDPATAVDNTERRVAAALRGIGPRPVTVNLNSPGGNYFNGVAIYNLLRMHKARVTVNVISMAGSAASVIAMAGDEILMGDGSSLMVHNASGVVVGNKFDMMEISDFLKEVDLAMADLYAQRAGVDLSVAVGWMDRNRGDGTSFGPAAAISNGLADGRIDPSRIKSRGIAADAGSKPVPPERVIERALISAAGMSDNEAKALIAEVKTGTRDAAGPIKRDADEAWAAMARSLISTLR